MGVAGVTGSDLKKRIEHIMVNDVRASLTVWKKALLATAAAGAIAGPIAVGVLDAPRLRAQAAVTAEPRPAFDVTSVKPNNSGSGQIGMMPAGGGGWRASNVTLGMMVRVAYQLQDNQIVGGPTWLFQDRFDILGSGTAPGRDGLLFAKLQTLLADRFGLVTHNERREVPMFALVLAGRDGKIGPKMQPSTAGDCPSPPGPGAARGNPPAAAQMSPAQMQRCGIIFGPGRLSGGNLSMAQLATNLSRIVGSMVVDKTNLAGNFELTLEYRIPPWVAGRFSGPPPPLAPERPSIDGPQSFRIAGAARPQAGVHEGPVEVLVIDSAEKPTPD